MNTKRKNSPHADSVAAEDADTVDLMIYFYPVHYQISTTLEDIYSGGILTRKQVVVLQFLLIECASGRPVPRKIIEQAMRRWFEMSTSAISKTLRILAREPLEFVSISEDASSGRERVVELTPRGKQFLARTSAAAQEYADTLTKDIDPALLAHASQYFAALTAAYRRTPKPDRPPFPTATSTANNGDH